MPISLTKLLNQYSVPGGRYTYYPPHGSWKNDLNYFQWFDVVKENYNPEQGIDLYVHIPFCQSLCTFCGCNIRVTKSYQDIAPYLAALKNEWKFYQKILGEKITINSLYLGGGTPNFLNPVDLDQLLSLFTNQQNQTTQISIELDPRFVSTEQLAVLKNHNTHTLSFGVQDFDHDVLANVNREQKVDEILATLGKARELNFSRINIDLIYGLTHQTPESIDQTLNTLKYFTADTIALYPFAKVPWQNNAQKAFGDFKDFSREEMHELFAHGDNKLKEMGYTHIGMGHFVHQRSELLSAFNNKLLKRNIMGFTQRKSNLLIGLGVSSFSSSPTGHIQNEKVLEPYIMAIQKERMPIFKSHLVTPEELALENIFEKIICENSFTEADRLKILPQQETNFKAYLDALLIEQNSSGFSVTERGRYFLKNICQCWG